MTCHEIQELLAESFGVVTDEVRAHVDSCSDCQQYSDDLQAIGPKISDADSDWLTVDTEMFVAGINKRIDEQKQSTTVTPLWRSWAAGAAVVLLAVTAMFGGKQTTQIVSSDTNTEDYAWLDEELLDFSYILDEQTLDIMVNDVSRESYDVEQLIEELSDDEWNNLLQSFDVGELL